MDKRHTHIYIYVMQILIGLCIFMLLCFASFLVGGTDAGSLWGIATIHAKATLIPLAIYLLNFCFLIPRLFFRNRKLWFIFINLLIVAAVTLIPIYRMEAPDIGQIEKQIDGLSVTKLLAAGILMKLILYICLISIAVGMRYVVRWNDEKYKLEEERRRNTEAELNWLKNQLNPHFLFNTLNNISSLIQIDADKAQECIGQLSELLRYALYESSSQKVRIGDEIRFMDNYIKLMSLRCNEKTKIKARFDIFDERMTISPLLFISLIENAFKHGTSSHRESFITIDFGMDSKNLVFSCSNQIIRRPASDKSGSGIGIDNLRRRLELLYPGKHSYGQYEEDGVYVAIVRIMDIETYV